MDTPYSESADRLELIGRVRIALEGLMEIERYSWDARGALTLRGRLEAPADTVYATVRERMEQLGFTPFLRRSGGDDELLAVPGVIERHRPGVRLPAILFVATLATTLLTGALHEQPGCVATFDEMLALIGRVLTSPAALVAGLPFTLTLLGILLVHEMGHYIVGRLRRAPVSLPYFIPMPPFISITGTMGAVIVQREPMVDRRTVLEIGIAGPLAGLAVAVPLLLYGLTLSTVGPPPPSLGGCAVLQEGNSLLYLAAKYAVFGRVLPAGGEDVWLSPVAMGAWIGLLVTMLNLLPLGQLDGGHVAYALLGRRADVLAYAMIGLCVLLGLLVSDTWLFWGVLALLIGPRHPPPLNDISRLGPRHVALALFGLVVFVLIFMPSPIRIVTP